MDSQQALPRGGKSDGKATLLSLGTLVFWVAFVLILVIKSIGNTSLIYTGVEWLSAMYLIRNILYAVLLLKAIFLSTYRFSELWGVGLILVVSAISFLCCDDFMLTEFAIIAVAAKDTEPRKLATVFAAVKGCALAATIALYAIGVLPALYYENGNKEAYNTFGFCHRNVLGANIAILCLVWFCLRFRKMKIWDLLVWSAIGIGSYFLAYSRSSLLIIFMIIIGAYLFRWLELHIMKIPHLNRLVCAIFLLLALVSLICTLFYEADSPIWSLIDSIFTKRVRFANQCFEQSGFSLFGQELPLVSSIQAQMTDADKLILDNAYMRALLLHGIIPGVLYFLAYMFSLDRACRRKDSALLFGLLIFAVYGLSERYMLDVTYNLPLLAAVVCCFSPPSAQGAEDSNDHKTPLGHALDILKWILRIGKRAEK